MVTSTAVSCYIWGCLLCSHSNRYSWKGSMVEPGEGRRRAGEAGAEPGAGLGHHLGPVWSEHRGQRAQHAVSLPGHRGEHRQQLVALSSTRERQPCPHQRVTPHSRECWTAPPGDWAAALGQAESCALPGVGPTGSSEAGGPPAVHLSPRGLPLDPPPVIGQGPCPGAGQLPCRGPVPGRVSAEGSLEAEWLKYRGGESPT